MDEMLAKDASPRGLDAFTKRGGDKPWDQIGIEEKVERLRIELLEQRHLARNAATTANVAERLARTHQHGDGGTVLVPAAREGGFAGEALARRLDPLA